jgi:hypothetical protein
MNAQQRLARAYLKTVAAERIAKAKSDASTHVVRGTCPDCGLPLRRNLALSGWWQCAAYGEPAFRDAQFQGAAHCSFQCFTE